MVVWIAQWKCPRNHAALGAAWDDAEDDGDEAIKQGEELFRSGVLNRHCGICGGALEVTREKTVFKTMAEATPVLMAVSAQNLAARSMIEMLRGRAHRN